MPPYMLTWELIPFRFCDASHKPPGDMRLRIRNADFHQVREDREVQRWVDEQLQVREDSDMLDYYNESILMRGSHRRLP
jgi:hypothetical protein